MSGNTFGTLFTVTSFGESHGAAIGCVIDGCPPGLALCEADIQVELDRRKPGTSRHVTQRREPDTVEILSGVFEGKTTGTPIGLLIRNQDQRSKDYGNIAETFRPGHADYAYTQKYGFRDYRGGGRSSARETAVRVAAGAIARKWLQERYRVTIRGWMSQLGPIEIPFVSADAIDQNPFFAPSADVVPQLEAFMDDLRKSGDSIGARISVMASGLPPGWGEPVSDWRPQENVGTDLCYTTHPLVYGDWVELLPLKPTRIDIVIGENPGGWMGGLLLVEQEGRTYRRDAAGRAVLPLFALQPLTETEQASLRQFPGFAIEERTPIMGIRSDMAFLEKAKASNDEVKVTVE